MSEPRAVYYTDRAAYANADGRNLPLAAGSVHMIATSPPYWGLRSYGHWKMQMLWGDAAAFCPPRRAKKRARWSYSLHWRAAENGGVTSPDGRAWVGAFGGEKLHDCLAWARGEPPCSACYVCHMRTWAREMWRVLRDDGVMFLNLGDSYASSGKAGPVSEKATWHGGGDYDVIPLGRAPTPPGLKPKDLAGIPWRVALALQADGWYLRSDIIWAKPNPMPESVTDRPTKAHEYIFLLTKSPRYFWDAEAVKEPNSSPEQQEHNRKYAREYAAYDDRAATTGQPGNVNNVGIHSRPGGDGRNIRTVWNITTAPYSGAHYATWPPALVERMIRAGTSERGVCPECGKPWARVVEKGEAVNRPDNPNDVQPYHGGNGYNNGNGATTLHKVRQIETLDWRPTCDHDDDAPVPAIVLDPFAGSGTTLMVARQLGRIGLGFDLSEKYLRENAAVRLGHDKLVAWGNGIKDTADYGDLFRSAAP